MAVVQLTPVTSNTKSISEEIPNFPKGAVAVVLSDVDTFSAPVTLYVGTGGNVAVGTPLNAGPVIFKNVAAGRVLPVQVTQVYSTDTTAADIVGVY